MPDTTREWVLALLPAIVIAVSALGAVVASWRAAHRRRKGLPVAGVYPGSARHRADLAATRRPPADDAGIRAAAAEAAGERAVDDASRYRSPHHP